MFNSLPEGSTSKPTGQWDDHTSEILALEGDETIMTIYRELPLDIARVILEDVAREARHLAVWMCYVNRTLQQWIEPILYHTIDVASSECPGTITLIETLQTRPDSFFHKHVKVLRLGMHLSAQDMALIASKCLGIHTLECWYKLPLEAGTMRGQRALGQYFDTLLGGVMKPSKIIIDVDEHHDSYQKFTLHAPLFQNLTHLELLCMAWSKSIGPQLLALKRLARLKIQVWFRDSRQLDVESYKQCVDRVLTFCPPTVHTFVFFCAELRREFFTNPMITQMANGEYDQRLVLGSLCWQKGASVRDWCLLGRFGEDVWEEAERIIRSRA